jgi:Rrf2 family transcriptional regulator, nitric oxide-sensitive transcriptional repressor
LIYVGTRPDQVVPASGVAEAYGISVDHVAKAAKWLTQHGYVRSSRGKAGGIQLARPADSVRLGTLVRETEPDMALVECFRPVGNTCPITPVCQLKHALERARAAFLAVLDSYTLADMLTNAPELIRLLPANRATSR